VRTSALVVGFCVAAGVGFACGWALRGEGSEASLPVGAETAEVVPAREEPVTAPPESLGGSDADCADEAAEVERLKGLLAQVSATAGASSELETLATLETGVPFDERLGDAYHPTAVRALVDRLDAWLGEQEIDPTASVATVDCATAPCILILDEATESRPGGGYGNRTALSAPLADWLEGEGYDSALFNHFMSYRDRSYRVAAVRPPSIASEQPDLAALLEASFRHRLDAAMAELREETPD